MADNVAITAGTGTTIAADDVGGVLFQRVKPAFGVDGVAVDVSATNPLPVQTPSVTYTDKSGTITAGGVAQTLAASNTSRKGFWIQNVSAGDLWMSTVGTAAATQPSLWLPPGAFYEVPAHGVPTAAVSIYGATTGQAFSAREW